MTDNEFYINCVCIDAILWIMFFIYSIICFVIKKIKHKETNVSVGSVICWIILAICSSIFGPIPLAIFVFCCLVWIISLVVPFLWNHGLESACEWLFNTEI